MIRITSILLLLSITIYGNGEDIKTLRYGKVTLEELNMTKYEKDTSADAVVLFTSGEFDPVNFKFTTHTRIKVLRQTGSSYGNTGFSGKLKGRIKGCTYNLENGEIVKSPLKKESIFEERVYGEQYVTRVALPSVRVGSVFEVEVTQDLVPNYFDFQKSIPVIYAALSFPQNPVVDIKMQEYGTLGFATRTNSTWIAKDVPAFEEEPFMRSEKDYKLRIEFELSSIKAPGYYAIYSESWNAVSKYYMANKNFGGQLDWVNFSLKQMADSVKATATTDEEKVTKAYEIVQRRIKWNKVNDCFASKNFDKTIELKSGNSADINLVLVALLVKLGIPSEPVLFSTRENGKISPYFPTIDKFNYVIATAPLEGKTLYLDASQEYLPCGLIPTKLLGCLGHRANSQEIKGIQSVLLEPVQKDKISTFNNFTLDSTGVINGKVTISREDYNAVDFKEDLKTYADLDAYIQKLESENTGIRIDSYNFSDVNILTKPFKEELNVTIGSLNSNNDVVVINPIVFPEIKNNPFTKEKRVTPTSFPQGIDYSAVVNIQLPQNYRVAEAPKSGIIANPDKTVKYSYKIDFNDTQISVRMRLSVDKLNHDLSEYSILRQIFEMMVQKQSESIILKKI